MSDNAVTAWVVAAFFLLSISATEPQAQSETGAMRRIPVKAITVGKSDQNAVAGMGSISCSVALDLGFDVPGVIEKILVKEGDRVSEGQALAKLDQRVVDGELSVERAGVKAARAEFEFQNSEFEKKKELFENGSISESEFLRAKFEREKPVTAIESANKKVDLAQAKKDKMVLLAPTSGDISKLYLKEGEVTNYSAYKVLRLIDCREVDAEIELGEKIYSAMGKGHEIMLVVDAVPNRKFRGLISHISHEINPKTRTFTVRARLANQDMLLRPGMFVRAEIDVSRISGPLLIPERALINFPGGGEAVFIIKDGSAIRRKVRVGSRDVGKAQITSGLNNGDVVVIEGTDLLTDLSSVSATIVESNE